MEQMNFSVRCRYWIKGCLSSGRVSILVKGSATKEFDMEGLSVDMGLDKVIRSHLFTYDCYGGFEY